MNMIVQQLIGAGCPRITLSERLFSGKTPRVCRLQLGRLLVMILFMCLGYEVLAVRAEAQAQLTNPIISHPDPFITFYNGSYYLLATQGSNITIWASPQMENLGASGQVVWSPPNDGSVASTLTAIYSPTLWHMNGRWWIYFTATSDGINADHQIYVLESTTDSLQLTGSNPTVFTYAAQMNTGNSALDPSILTVNGNTYLMYVRFPNVTENDIYMGQLSDPLTFAHGTPSSPFITPIYMWEKGGSNSGYGVTEGPTALYANGKTFIVYSGSLTQTPVYCLGLLTYNGSGDVTAPSNWTRNTTPVFQEDPANSVYGPGRGTFTVSPDGQENWLLFAAKTTNVYTAAGRTTRGQTFSYDMNGNPVFGSPMALSTTQNAPSGEGQAAVPPSISFAQQSDQLNGAPAMAANNNVLSIAFRSNDSTNTLWIDSSLDGQTLQGAQHFANITMGSAPALKRFQSTMYLAFQSNSDDSLWVCSYQTLPTISCSHITTAGAAGFPIHMNGAPSLCAPNGRLYVSYLTSALDSNGANHVAVISSANGTTFDQGQVFGSTAGTPPTIAGYNGQIVAAFQSNDSRQVLFLQQIPYNLGSISESASYETTLATSPALVSVQPSTSSFPTLMIAYKGTDAGQHLNYQPFYGVSLYASTQDGASIGSAPSEAQWTPNQGPNLGKPIITVAFRSQDNSNHLWMGSAAIP